MLSDRNGPPPPDENDDHDLIPELVPPLPVENQMARNLPWRTALGWLKQGWSDMWTNPIPSLIYGIGVFLVSVFVVWLLLRFQMDYALFPALAGFLVIGPLVANGLYIKSRDLEDGKNATLGQMLFVKPRSLVSTFFMGVILLMLFLLWNRAAVLLWALFFGVQPFPGMDEIVWTLFTTPTGLSLLLVGGAVGALFAAFSFAISVFAAPMLLEERTDALSALGISMAMVWNNRPVMIAWGAIVLALFVFSIVTALFGLIVVFPLLGHGTWHAYRAIRSTDAVQTEDQRMFISPM
ncbi:DUF2189 domain-containing protein [Paracoccus tegillarcae]|uniref:DUF2189 domain-containing protein n=1 Tax=Paracoccus tegillarcae TaxID=1529068 RepID=A0A2K9EX90_9RHOB|nr:DUF2189 domain-containing protein [Paracoccus tegillarcae]AUH32682.1 hypothetical protein CUV01_04145 [Paracoccus tegillarcae]